MIPHALGHPRFYVNAFWSDNNNHMVNHHALLEEIGYLLMYVAVNPVVFQLVHELVMGHHVESLAEIESYIHLEFMVKQ